MVQDEGMARGGVQGNGEESGAGPGAGGEESPLGGALAPVGGLQEEPVQEHMEEPAPGDWPENEDDLGSGVGEGAGVRAWSGDPDDEVDDDDDDYVLDLRGEDSMTLVRAVYSVMGADGFCRNLQITVSQVQGLPVTRYLDRSLRSPAPYTGSSLLRPPGASQSATPRRSSLALPPPATRSLGSVPRPDSFPRNFAVSCGKGGCRGDEAPLAPP